MSYARDKPYVNWKQEKRRLKQKAAEEANEARRAAEAKKDEEYRYLPTSYRAFDELAEVTDTYTAEKIKALIEAMIQERHDR